MEFEDVWRKVCAINPRLKPGVTVEITEENLRKITYFAYQQGAKSVERGGSKAESWFLDAIFGR